MHPPFPNRTNVQFVPVVDSHRIVAGMWDRAGYTLASGSGACAAAAASVRSGLRDRAVTVVMPGGELAIGIGAAFELTMLGPVLSLADGTVAEELLRCQFDRGDAHEGTRHRWRYHCIAYASRPTCPPQYDRAAARASAVLGRDLPA